MMTLRKSQDRGYFEIDWLKSYHTFSFGDYYDPKNMHYRNLRVINHDLIAANGGFPLHPHRDMEIITYILQGTVAHKDSMGNQEQIHAGEVQVMTAGTGVRHSEYNPSSDANLELLQIWILPAVEGLAPAYQQRAFSREEKLNNLCLISSDDASGKALKINQDVKLYASILEKEKSLTYELKKDRKLWVQIAKGQLDVNSQKLSTGDGLAIENENAVNFKALDEVEFLVFDLN